MNDHPGHYVLFGEIPLGGNSFTRLSTNGDKLSKLDRFLISNDSLSHFEHYQASAVDCTVSDHRPIILKRVFVDFGPISFKLYNSWLNQTPVVDLVVTVWKQFQSCSGGSSFVIFKKFLKKVKGDIRMWQKQFIAIQNSVKNDLQSELKDIDDALEAGSGCPSVYQQRLSLLHQIKELEHQENLNAMQKAKIKWSIEADKNSKFFHGTIN
ncbi:RNA-directed DNA polymerase, eukaryota, reverse transcriptase zinc-binding domain protein [Tanacetum coccineum]